MISTMYIRLEGIFGMAMGTSATYIYVFVLFGAFLMRMGGGEFFMGLAQAVLGGFRGGPAKVAVLASAFFATITGQGAANVAATGVVTIPTMIKTGYPRKIAGAIEASASIGGQITPPIMGASAFLMADFLGIRYFDVCMAAIIPSFFFFLSIYLIADLEAAKNGLTGLSKEERPRVGPILRQGWHFIVPILVLLYFLSVTQVSPARGAVYGAFSFVPFWLGRELVARRPIDLRKVLDALIDASKSAVLIAVACASVGIIMNVTDITGLGLKFTSLIINYAGGNLYILLMLTMCASLLLGLGLPTVVSYMIVAILVAPALTKMGILPIAAHLFCLYFAVISDITPPTAISCYVAGAIAKESGMRVAFQACRIALPGFIVPYVFVQAPALMMEGSAIKIIYGVIVVSMGVLGLAVGLSGYWFSKITPIERILAVLGGISLIHPSVYTDAIGVGFLGLVGVLSWLRRARLRVTK